MHWAIIKENTLVHISVAEDKSNERIAGFNDNASEAINPYVLIELD